MPTVSKVIGSHVSSIGNQSAQVSRDLCLQDTEKSPISALQDLRTQALKSQVISSRGYDIPTKLLHSESLPRRSQARSAQTKTGNLINKQNGVTSA